MNILWVTPQFPCKRTGGQVRQFYLIRELSKRHQLTVISLLRSEEKLEPSALENWGVEVITVPFIPPQRRQGWGNRLQSWSKAVFNSSPHFADIYPIENLKPALVQAWEQRNWDVVQYEFLYSAPLSASIGKHKWVLTAHNVESLNAFSQAKLEPKATYRLKASNEAAKLKRWERKWVERSTACITMSELDKNRLLQIAPEGKYFVVPNGVDVQAYKPDPKNNRSKNRIVFFGNLGYPPNLNGLRWFLREVFLQLRESLPDVSLDIIGPHAEGALLEFRKYPGVTFVGFVEDIRLYLWNAEVCIVPLFSGGGTRLKILEAAAAGCAIVSTSIGVEGLAITNGRDYLEANDPLDFKCKLIELSKNPELKEMISQNAFEVVKKKYDWASISPQLESVYNSILTTHLSQ